MNFKTFENWNGSLNEYLQKGDIVDAEFYNYFLDVLPPVTFNNNIVQLGEPYSHVNGKATYSTIARTEDGWMYCGNCHRGEIEEPKEDRLLIKFIKETACIVLYNEDKTDVTDYEFIDYNELEEMKISDLERIAYKLADRNYLERFRFDASEYYNS